MSDQPNLVPKTRRKTSRTKQPKLLFPVYRAHRFLQNGMHMQTNRIGRKAPLALAVIVEYLASQLLSLSGEIAKKFNVKRITPRHLLLAIRMDNELNKLLSDITIAQGGVMPTFLDED